MLRIIRFLICLFGTFGALMALAQTPNPLPVQGNLSSIIGSGQQYAGVSIQLQNCASPVSIAGYSVIVQQGYQVMANGAGLVNTTVWPNDIITCNGTTGNSQYQLSYTANGAVQGTPQCYQVVSIQGTWNLNTQQPITCSQSAPNPADVQYRNLNLTGFLSGVSGSMSGSWQAATFISTGLAGSVGKCVQVGAGGLLIAASVVCGGTAGVSTIVAGTNVTISPSGGTGAVTINATGGSSGGTINRADIGDIAYYNNTNSIEGEGVCTISQGCTGQTTAPSALAALGAAPYGGPGIQFNISQTIGRPASGGDIVTLLGYEPLMPSANLSDVIYPAIALKNLFGLAGLISTQAIGTDAIGNALPITFGPGLAYQSSVGYGSVMTVTVNTVGIYSVCPTLSFSGGGGSGAAATSICNTLTGGHTWRLIGATVTAGGSGYTSAPTVVISDTTGGGVLTASVGATASITSSWQSSTRYSAAGTPLPSCSSTTLLQRLAVSDATVATPGSTYAGSGTYTIPVECIFNATGSVYTWIID